MSPLSNFSIRMQILIGFLPVILVLGVWLFSSHKNFNSFSNTFNALLHISEEGQAFTEIEKDIIELQRNILVYSYVGYRGVLKKITVLQSKIENRFEEIRPIAEQDDVIKGRFIRLYNHYRNYKNVFADAIKKKDQLKELETSKLKPTIKKNHGIITILIKSFEREKNYEAAYLASKIELDLLQIDANIWSFSTTPDASIIRETHTLINQIKNNITLLQEFTVNAENIEYLSELSTLMQSYKETLTEVSNVNRIYSHMMNVVLAGKAAEIDLLSRELEQLIIERAVILKKGIKNDIEKSYDQYIQLSISIGIIGILSALFIATGIARPVKSMASTLSRLARGEADIEIPGQTRNDEMGEMAKAANEFKTMAIRLREHQKAIKKSEAQLSAIMDNTIDGMITINERGEIESYNKACEDLFGFKAEEAIGQNVKMLMPEPYQSEHDGYLQKHKETGKETIIGIGREVSGKRKDGSVFPMDLSVAKIDIEGKVLYSGIVRDISERKHIEDTLNERFEFERLVTNSIPDLVFVKDKDFKIVQANDAFLSLYPEETRGKVIGSTTFEEYPPEDVKKFTANDRTAFKTGYHETEEIVHFPNGEVKTLFTKKVRFKNSTGDAFILAVARDITELKQITNNLRKQKEMLELGEETATLGHWHVNTVTSQVFWSDQVYKIHDTSPDKYTPDLDSAINYYHPDDRADIEAIIQEALENKAPFEFEKRIITDKGHTIYVHSIGHPELDQKEEVIGVFGVIQDITDRKKSEEALLRSNRELDDFAYIASHDLKEPLRGLHNHARFLLEDYEDKLDEDGKHKLGRLIYLSQRMEKLTSDLLYYSRLGRTETEPEEIDHEEIVLDIKELLADKENTSINIKGTLPKIMGEHVRIEELYRNLITNAIKYNESANKDVEVGVTKDGSLYVKDNGIGIDPKFHDDIFKIFKRLHKREAYGGGSGSGLTFVKKIIDSHNGKIWVESAVGKGTTFYFTLPISNKKTEV